MSGTTFSIEAIRLAISSSLYNYGYYQKRLNGDLVYIGTRPGEGWHSHGSYPTKPAMLENGEVVTKTVHKQRWKHKKTGKTCHSQPPDLLPRVRSCTLIILTALWSWLSSEASVIHHQAVLPDLDGHVSNRTLGRWLQNATDQAEEIQQNTRQVAIERCEPRPFEELFPSGLSPPEKLSRRCWRAPSLVQTLWRGFAIGIGTSIELAVPTSVLMAEARGRMRP